MSRVRMQKRQVQSGDCMRRGDCAPGGSGSTPPQWKLANDGLSRVAWRKTITSSAVCCG